MQVPAQAVHDTVAAILRHRAYLRAHRTSLLGIIWRWLIEHLRRWFPDVSHTPHGKLYAWLVLGAGIALVIARFLYVARASEAPERALRARGVRRTADDHWRDAEQAAADGRFTEAAHSLYKAVLQTLSRRERLKLHHAKTAGDYARELRAMQSPSHRAFREFGRAYDRIIYGLGRCDAGGWARLRALAAPMLVPDERAA